MTNFTPIVQMLINVPENSHPHCMWHVPDAMIAEALLNIPGSFDGEQVRQGGRSETHAPLLQPIPIGAAYRYIFRVVRSKLGILAGLHQAKASKGETAVAHIMSIRKLRPARADIVIIKKLGSPARCVEHMAIPLHNQAMRRVDMIHDAMQNEFRIAVG